MSERKRILQSSTEVGTRRALKGFFHAGTLCNKWRRLFTNSFNRPGDLHLPPFPQEHQSFLQIESVSRNIGEQDRPIGEFPGPLPDRSVSPQRLGFQIGASKLRHFFGNPDDEQAHQIAVFIGDPYPEFFGLSHLLRKQGIQLQRLALWGEVTWFWLEHGSVCNCQPHVELQCFPSPGSPDPRYINCQQAVVPL
jgi:hypothetical protein